jgi:hypothetical protein
VSSKYEYYSMEDSTRDVSKSAPVIRSRLDQTEVLSKNTSQLPTRTRTAIILKSEEISLDNIPVSHSKFRDLINPESLPTESDKAINLIRHYCAVEGHCSYTDPTTVPPELLTVIYEASFNSEDDTSLNQRYGKINVNMLSNSYGILKNHVHPNAFVSTGGPTPEPKKVVEGFKKKKTIKLKDAKDVLEQLWPSGPGKT